LAGPAQESDWWQLSLASCHAESANWIGQSGANFQDEPFLELADSMFDCVSSDLATADSEFLAGKFNFHILML